jgi:hypothetical protein
LEANELYRLTFGTDKGKTRALTIQNARKGLSPSALAALLDNIINSGALRDPDSGTVVKLKKGLDVTETRKTYDLS